MFPCIFPSQPQAQASLRPCTAKAIPATPERTIQSLAQSIGLIAISIPLGAFCCCPTAVGMRNHSQDILVGVTSFSLDKRYMLIYIYVYIRICIYIYICDQGNFQNAYIDFFNSSVFISPCAQQNQSTPQVTEVIILRPSQDAEDFPGHCHWCFRQKLRSR